MRWEWSTTRKTNSRCGKKIGTTRGKEDDPEEEDQEEDQKEDQEDEEEIDDDDEVKDDQYESKDDEKGKYAVANESEEQSKANTRVLDQGSDDNSSHHEYDNTGGRDDGQ